MNWDKFKNGISLGQKGSEEGYIIDDIEHLEGARITIEKTGVTAPFSVTLGIYGLMMHTHFASTLEEAEKYKEFAVLKIDQIFELYSISDEQQDEDWNEQLNLRMKELSE